MTEPRFPEREHTSELEMWLDEDGLVRVRWGIRVLELLPEEAREVGLALVELADAGDEADAQAPVDDGDA